MWVNAQVSTMGKISHKIHISHASGPSLLKSLWLVVITFFCSSVVSELIESNIGNLTKPLFFLPSSAQRLSHKNSGDCDMFIRTEWQKVNFVNYQAKMEAQRVRQSNAFLLYPQTVLTVNVDEDRCSAPGVSTELSSLGKEGEAWSSFKLSWDNGAQELPLEQQCFERKHPLLWQ